MDVAGKVPDDFAVVTKGASPRRVLSRTGHRTAEDIAGVNERVVGCGASGIHLPAFLHRCQRTRSSMVRIGYGRTLKLAHDVAMAGLCDHSIDCRGGSV